MDLFNELQELTKKLSTSINQMAKYGRELAEAESDYEIKLRQEALKLRNDDKMAVTLINQIVYGIPEVANKRLKRDIAETMYKTSQEYINTLKLRIRVLESQLQREWGNTRG
jgi:hypothetical protein